MRETEVRISVALCTYCGEAFLEKQLESVAAQTRPPNELIVCDDGSYDGTVRILQKFATEASFPVRVYLNQTRLGVAANFHKALKLCSGELTAFSDQDDIWLPNKLFRAERRILETKDPSTSLYCSRLSYVDADLSPLAVSVIPSAIGFHNAIVENIATGCSAVFGSEIRERFLRAAPENMIMHDWWAYLIASAYGEVIFDSEPGVLYRQHGQNVTGWESRPLKLWNRALWLAQRLLAQRQGMDSLNQAERFLASYPDVPIECRLQVEKLLRLRDESMLARLRYLFNKPYIQRNDLVENFALKIMLLMGWH